MDVPASDGGVTGTGNGYLLSWLLNDNVLIYPNVPSICSEIECANTTLEMLEMKLVNTNQDRFIDLSYT